MSHVVLTDAYRYRIINVNPRLPTIFQSVETPDGIVEATFVYTWDEWGDLMVYEQTAGPALPDSWWHR